MKTTKKILSLTLVAFIILTLSVVAYASGLYITSASNGISSSGSTVTMTQYTGASQTATKIKHYKVLQRYTGSSWVTYTTRTSYRYSSATYSDSKSVTVSTGYLYRVVTYHYVYDGTTLEDVEVRTSGQVFVG